MTARVLIIGLDSFDTGLMRKWAQTGALPNLAALLREGLWGPMLSYPGIFAGSTWASFATGCSPARHRRIFSLQACEGRYEETPFGVSDLNGPFFWESLGRVGKLVAVLDVPHTRLTPTAGGLNLVDWAPHHPGNPFAQSSPPTLLQDLDQKFGYLGPDNCDLIDQGPNSIEHLLETLLYRLENKLAVSLYCLQKADWDLFVTVFGESHCIGHHGWHLHDPSHPGYEPHLAVEIGDPVEAVYKALDGAVGELVSRAGEDTVTIVLNGEGMGPPYGAARALDEILWRLDTQPSLSRGQAFRALKRIWWTLPAQMRQSTPLALLERCSHPLLQRSSLIPGRRNRQFYAMPNNTSGGAVRINLRGRESHGCVEPGNDYHQVCDYLRTQLLALEDPETGDPVVKNVHNTTNVMSGPYLAEMPDLLIDWVERQPRSVYSPPTGIVAIPRPRNRSGDHLNQGMCIVKGAGVKAGQWTTSRSITDVAPTIGALLDVTLDDLDGTVIPI